MQSMQFRQESTIECGQKLHPLKLLQGLHKVETSTFSQSKTAKCEGLPYIYSKATCTLAASTKNIYPLHNRTNNEEILKNTPPTKYLARENK